MTSDSDCTCTFEDFIDGKCEMNTNDLLNTCNFPAYQQIAIRNNAFWKKYAEIFIMIATSVVALVIGFSSAYTEWWVFNISITILIAMITTILCYALSKHQKAVIASIIIGSALITIIWIFNRTNWINNGLDLSNVTYQLIKPLTIDYFKDILMYIGAIVCIALVGMLLAFIIQRLMKKYMNKQAKKIKEEVEEKIEEENPALNTLSDYSTSSLILLFILLPIAAFSEEIIFRWFGINSLYNIGFNIGWCIVIMAIIFGLGHPYGLDDILVTGMLGIILSFIFIDWGIVGSGIFHLAWNLVAVIGEYMQSRDVKKAIKKVLVFGIL